MIRSCSYWRWTTFVLWNSLFWRDSFALLLTISGFSFLGLSVLIFWSCQVSQSGSPLFQWPWTLGGNLLLALRSAGWDVRWIQNMLPNLKWIFAELWQVSLWIDIWFAKLLTCKCCWKKRMELVSVYVISIHKLQRKAGINQPSTCFEFSFHKPYKPSCRQ